MAHVGNVCVALWRKKPTPERFRIQKQYLDEAVRARPGEVAFLCIVEPGSEPPDEDVRKASSEMVSAHGTNLKCVALVIEGTGFRAAITRSVLSGIVLVIRSPAPVKYFDTPSSAAEWMRDRVDIHPMSTFIRQVEGLRNALPRE
jgi:hypothetical protein